MSNHYAHSSPPFEIDFLGFRGHSVELQRRGWDFSFERHLHRDCTAMAMRHNQTKLFAYMDRWEVARHDPRELRRPPVMIVNAVAPEIRIQQMGGISPFSSFNAVDVEPAMLTMEEWRLSGADIFRRYAPVAEEKKIYLADAGEMDLLQNLMQRQQPKQDEIRERLRLQRLRDEMEMPSQVVEAQIIRLANWR